MDNEKLQNESALNVDDVDNNQYIEAINKLKAKSVDKAKYEELVAENKKLLDTIVNGQEIELPKKSETIDIDALKNDIFSGENSNLDYCVKLLKLREGLIAKGENDPLLPYGYHITPTKEDVEEANHLVETLEECIEYANGDSSIFTTELQRRLIDTNPSSVRPKKIR